MTVKLLPVCLAVWVAVRATLRRHSNLSSGEVCLLRALSSRLARDKLMLQRHEKTEEEGAGGEEEERWEEERALQCFSTLLT